MKAVLDALGVSYVVEQGQDESGTWYRRFSNGWVEQGGKVTRGSEDNYPVTFPVEFVSIDYYITTGSQNVQGFFTPSVVIAVNNFTISGFTFNIGSHCTVVHWEAKGFAAH